MDKFRDKIICKYFVKCTILGILASLFLLFVFARVKTPVLILIAIIVTYVVCKLIITAIKKNSFLPILYHDLDPKKFEGVINSSKYYVCPISFRILSAIFNGDYQTAVNICTKLIKKKSSDKKKSVYLYLLAKIYFEVGDLKKLKVICDEFLKYSHNSPKNKNIFKKYSGMLFFLNFANGDYSSCIKNCEEYAKKKAKYKLNEVNLYFYYATAYFRLGDAEKAKKYFQLIIETAPKMYVADISRSYLEALDTNSKPSILNDSIVPDEDYQIFDDNSLSRYRKLKCIKAVITGVWLCLLVVLGVLNNYNWTTSNKTELLPIGTKDFETKLNEALSESYTDYRVLDCFTVEKLDDTRAICVVEDENKNVDLGFVVTIHGKKYSYLFCVNDIVEDKYYKMYTGMGDTYVGVRLYGNKSDIPIDNIKTVKISNLGWLCFE